MDSVSGPLDPSAPDADGPPTLKITIEDSQTYLSELEYVADRLLIQVLPGSLTDAATLAAAVGASVLDFDERTRAAVLQVGSDDLAATATRLAGLPAVEHVEKEYLLPAAALPTDPEYANQWHLRHIGAERAWDLTTGDAKLIIAVVDSGIDVSHPDLRDRLIAGYNFVSNNTDANDCCGHGTKVAGTIGAITNNGVGIAGLTWSGKILPVRVAYHDGTKTLAKLSDIARGIIWATDQGAAVINVSFSGVLDSTTIQNACQYAVVNGRLVVASMGNTGVRDAAADSPWTISVSATDSSDAPAGFSTYGPAVDLAAPGVGILTTQSGGGYTTVNGTSFSSPLTCGVIALMWSLRPEATPTQIQDLLLSSVDDLGSPGVDEFFGHGVLNAQAGVQSARDAVLPPDTTPPSVRFTSPVDGARLSGSTRIEIDAHDDHLIRNVALSVDGIELARDASVPFAFLLDPQAGTSGTHRLTATAIDLAGNVSDQAALDVTFEAQPDTTPPGVTITVPQPGDLLTGRVAVAARLEDTRGLARVSMILDGVVLASGELSGSVALVEFSWNASAAGVQPGPHVVGVRVDNQAGLTAMAAIDVTTQR